MNSNWSDFLATPPNLDSPSNPLIPDFSIDSSLQPPSNYVLSSSQYSNIFQQPQQPPQSNINCCCNFQQNQQLPSMPKPPPQTSNLSCELSDQPLKTTQNSSQNDSINTNIHHNTKPGYNRNVYIPGNDNNNNNNNNNNMYNGFKNYRNSDGQSNYESPVDNYEQPSPPPSPNTNLNLNKNTNINSYQTNFNEIENRTLFISNLNPQLTLDEIKQVFDPNNNSKSIDTSNLKTNCNVTIEYFDLRQAQAIKKNLNGTTINLTSSSFGPISVVYAPLKKIPDPRRPPNNGTIVVFHLPAGVTESHIESSFGSFGSIREIRGTPQKPGQRFIEFWDTRAAEAALNALNGKYVMGSKVSIEFSLPGGFRRNIQPYNTMIVRDSQNKNNVFNNCGSFKQGNGATSNHNYGQNPSFVAPSNMQNKF